MIVLELAFFVLTNFAAYMKYHIKSLIYFKSETVICFILFYLRKEKA